MENFQILEYVGEGAHGYVLKAADLQRDRVVALKKIFIRSSERGIPPSVMREIELLRRVKHKYIIKFWDYFTHEGSVVLALEYAPSGLWEMLRDSKQRLQLRHVKTYMQMMLRALSYLHDNAIMHRDLKPNNLLIDEKGLLKMADFGSSRKFGPDEQPYSHQTGTRWYRSPELLYGSQNYDESVDLWALGCIFAEMIQRKPLFPGEGDIAQLAMILRNLGTPTDESWPRVKNLPDYGKITFPPSDGKPIVQLVSNCDPDCGQLIGEFLHLNPEKRTSAEQALKHKFFQKWPLPCPETEMPIPPPDHRKIVKRAAESAEADDFCEEFEALLSV